MKVYCTCPEWLRYRGRFYLYLKCQDEAHPGMWFWRVRLRAPEIFKKAFGFTNSKTAAIRIAKQYIRRRLYERVKRFVE